MTDHRGLSIFALTAVSFLPAMILLFFSWSVRISNTQVPIQSWRRETYKWGLIAASVSTAWFLVFGFLSQLPKNRRTSSRAMAVDESSGLLALGCGRGSFTRRQGRWKNSTVLLEHHVVSWSRRPSFGDDPLGVWGIVDRAHLRVRRMLRRP
jgi:hypothetical protein